MDLLPLYPAAYSLPNIISVGSINSSGAISAFSNYGVNTVDLFAPGEAILSTTAGNSYATFSGTSKSTTGFDFD